MVMWCNKSHPRPYSYTRTGLWESHARADTRKRASTKVDHPRAPSLEKPCYPKPNRLFRVASWTSFATYQGRKPVPPLNEPDTCVHVPRARISKAVSHTA